jgi:hypothetical protein
LQFRNCHKSSNLFSFSSFLNNSDPKLITFSQGDSYTKKSQPILSKISSLTSDYSAAKQSLFLKQILSLSSGVTNHYLQPNPNQLSDFFTRGSSEVAMANKLHQIETQNWVSDHENYSLGLKTIRPKKGTNENE